MRFNLSQTYFHPVFFHDVRPLCLSFMLWNVPELDLPKPAELRACQDSGRSQNPPRGPCSLKAKCAVPLFVPLRKPYLKWHETDDFVPWSLGEMSDWGIPHVLGRCSFVIKQQVFFSALQQRGDRFVFWLVAEDRRGVLSQTLSS